MRKRLILLAVAALIAVALVGSSGVGVAQSGEACRDLPGVGKTGGDPAGTTPVVLVHGFTGSDASWFAPIDHTIDDDVAPIDRSMVEQLMRIDGVSVFTFDYHDASNRWVTNDRIAGALADLLECLSGAGAYPAVVVAHSMGGLAAREAVARLPDPTVVSGLVTFGTPHLGSDTAAYAAQVLDSDASAAVAGATDPLGIGSAMWMWFRSELEDCWEIKTSNPDGACDNFGDLPPLGSEAGVALQTGSTQLGALPLLPDHIRTLAIAGDIDIAVQGAAGGPLPYVGWWYQDVAHFPVGDTLVSVPSATHTADEVVTRTCQANVKAGYALSDDFRRLAQINYDDGTERPFTEIMGFACAHTNLTRTVELTNQALGFINDIAEDQRPFRWQGSSSELALEFVRRALAGESVLELALTFQFTDLDGSIAPSDNSWALTVPSEIRDTYTAPVALSPDEAYGDSEGPGCRFEGDLHIGCSVTISDALGKRGTIAVSMSSPGGSLGVDAYTHTPAGATVGAELPEILRNEIIDAIERNDAVSLRAFLPDDGTWESTGAIVLDRFGEPDPGPLLCFEFGAESLDCPIYAGDQPMLLMLHIVFDNRAGLWAVDSAWIEDCCY